MMTAGHIAKALKCDEVTINYRASGVMLELLGENPLPNLEYV